MDNKVFISTACLKGDKSYERVLSTFVKNRIFNIELTGVHPHISMKSLEDTIKYYINKKVNFTFHNYFPPPKKSIVLNFLTRDKKLKKECEGIISKSISLAKKTNVSTYAFHPGYLREANMNVKGYFDFYGKKRMSKSKALEIFKEEFYNFYKRQKLIKKISLHFLVLKTCFQIQMERMTHLCVLMTK